MFSYLERLGTDIVSFISVGRFLQWSGDRDDVCLRVGSGENAVKVTMQSRRGRRGGSISHADMQAMLTVLVDAVFLQDTGTAGTVAYAKHSTVYGEDGVVAFLQLMVVTDCSNVLRSVVESGERERGIDCRDADFPAGLGAQRDVGCLTVIAAVLWHRIVGILVCHLRLPQTDMAGTPTVWVSVPRTTTIIL